jgi:hypothetical protein
VVAEGPYDQKKLQGKEQTLTSLWLYWTPERPLTPSPAAPKPTNPSTPTPSSRVKKEKIIKKEDNVKEEPLTSAKRSRAISSTTGITRATRRQTRNQRQVTDDELPLDALALLGRTRARGKEVGKAGEGEGEGENGEDAEAKGSDEEVPTPLA